MLQNPCKTLGFKKNMVYKIPPGGGGKPYPASGLCGLLSNSKQSITSLSLLVGTTLFIHPIVVMFLFVLIHYVPVNYFSVMSGRFPVFLGGTSTKQWIKCLAQGHATVTQLSLYQLQHFL